jgi:hypothetical protein
MSTPWDDDVAEAVRCALAGQCENWPLTARTLAAEVQELRAKVIEHEIRELKRCPVCHDVALGVVKELGQQTRYHHETSTHLDQWPVWPIDTPHFGG